MYKFYCIYIHVQSIQHAWQIHFMLNYNICCVYTKCMTIQHHINIVWMLQHNSSYIVLYGTWARYGAPTVYLSTAFSFVCMQQTMTATAYTHPVFFYCLISSSHMVSTIFPVRVQRIFRFVICDSASVGQIDISYFMNQLNFCFCFEWQRDSQRPLYTSKHS